MFCYTTKTEPANPAVVAILVHVAAAEEQEARVRTDHSTAPVVPERADVEERAIVVVAFASSGKEERRLGTVGRSNQITGSSGTVPFPEIA